MSTTTGSDSSDDMPLAQRRDPSSGSTAEKGEAGRDPANPQSRRTFGDKGPKMSAPDHPTTGGKGPTKTVPHQQQNDSSPKPGAQRRKQGQKTVPDQGPKSLANAVLPAADEASVDSSNGRATTTESQELPADNQPSLQPNGKRKRADKEGAGLAEDVTKPAAKRRKAAGPRKQDPRFKDSQPTEIAEPAMQSSSNGKRPNEETVGILDWAKGSAAKKPKASASTPQDVSNANASAPKQKRKYNRKPKPEAPAVPDSLTQGLPASTEGPANGSKPVAKPKRQYAKKPKLTAEQKRANLIQSARESTQVDVTGQSAPQHPDGHQATVQETKPAKRKRDPAEDGTVPEGEFQLTEGTPKLRKRRCAKKLKTDEMSDADMHHYLELAAKTLKSESSDVDEEPNVKKRQRRQRQLSPRTHGLVTQAKEQELSRQVAESRRRSQLILQSTEQGASPNLLMMVKSLGEEPDDPREALDETLPGLSKALGSIKELEVLVREKIDHLSRTWELERKLGITFSD
ncbi:MAG: hypothetical protein M1828_002977 [Chrysothrix sp. TS-e1954]|nr:MAG: hypothetical protein M1828_002977 [Chrysothrix sp. TS-e1954]